MSKQPPDPAAAEPTSTDAVATPEATSEAAPKASSDRFKHLPKPIDIKDTVTSQPASTPPDDEGGRNNETDFAIRYGL